MSEKPWTMDDHLRVLRAYLERVRDATDPVPRSGAFVALDHLNEIEKLAEWNFSDENDLLDAVMGVLDAVASDADAGRLDRRNCQEDAEEIIGMVRAFVLRTKGGQ